MNEIKINCPDCGKPQSYSRVTLVKTQGHVVCKDCHHMFRVLKQTGKSNKAVETVAVPSDAAQTGKAAPKQPEKANPAARAKPAAGKNAAAREYRIPKAQPAAKAAPQAKRTEFAEVESAPFAFNLLEREEQTANVPQLLPAENGTRMQARTPQGENITIHTDNLVFTLVGDPAVPQPLSPAVPNQPPSPPALPPAATHEINWTIATIAALIVLILQLFYLMMMFP